MAAPARTSSSGKIVLVGCHGEVGKATMCAIDRAVGCANLLVLTRETSGFELPEHACKGCKIEHGDLNDVESLKPHFTGASAVFIVTPGAENRAELVRNGLTAAKASRVPFVLVVSTMTATNARTVFGAQFSEIEKATKDSGIPYALLRLPLFYDNLLMQKDLLRSGKLWGPFEPTAKFTKIATHDVGEAAATILINPASHNNKTYNIVGPAWCLNDAVTAFSTVLGRRVAYEQQTYETYQKFLVDHGMEAWQARGTIELLHMIEDGTYNFKDSDYKKLTGKEPWTINQWIEHHRAEILGEAAPGTGTGAGTAYAGGAGAKPGASRGRMEEGGVTGKGVPATGAASISGAEGSGSFEDAPTMPRHEGKPREGAGMMPASGSKPGSGPSAAMPGGFGGSSHTTAAGASSTTIAGGHSTGMPGRS